MLRNPFLDFLDPASYCGANKAAWPSGKAGVCKTLIPSSTLGAASKFINIIFQENRGFKSIYL